ncbi:MBL fold metallo-hydrolase [Marinilabilia rubra]|uniref:MBL fold hydrolase n=1 Tax=Marinilabilia rubra TaxID=2162893 RepID=A0A2U2B8C0_9BACT|nr:MBL fold metallo-hydrolase [Marinilabilia rubra]PWD99292.1 MBL fold hydrolase [Marinilabilia rubra]
MIYVENLVFNPFQENTYIVYNDKKDCAIVDPGMLFPQEEEMLVDRINSLGLTPKLLLQTHLHVDHVLGAAFVAKTWGILPMAHEGDDFLVGQAKNMAAGFGMDLKENPPAPDKHLREGDIIELGEVKFEVIHLPGHSPGGIAFYAKDEKVLLVGDVLFKGSVGRSDLPGGNQHELIDAIQTKLLVLPEDVKVYSGHGPVTTIGEEKRTNPFLQ